MMEYMFNAFLVFSTYMYGIVAVAVIGWSLHKSSTLFFDKVSELNEFRMFIKKATGVIVTVLFVVGVFLTLTSPSLTYKQSTMDTKQELKKFTEQIEQEAEKESDKPIKDLNLQPKKTDEERKQNFDDLTDWRNH